MNDITIRSTRKDWTVTTHADGYGTWHATVASDAGWGNAGLRDIGRHIDAIRGRARRALLKELAERSADGVAPKGMKLELVRSKQTSMGVITEVEFEESW